MSKPQIYLKGLEELERATNRIIKETTAGKRKILLDQAKDVRDAIREAAPKGETGKLKEAAYAAALSETTTSTAVAFAGIRPRKAPHAHLVEFGHGGPHPAPPHPFVRPAWDRMKEDVKQNIAAGMKKLVEGAV